MAAIRHNDLVFDGLSPSVLRLSGAQLQDVFCSTKPSWQGDRCAPPLHPPSCGSFRALNPFQSQKTVSPVKHSRETSLSLHPSIKGLSHPLNPLAGLGELPLHLHRTTHKQLPV